MKNLLNRYCPARMKRLWCQLAISYTLLAFVAMLLLMVMLYGMDDYHDFHAAITPANVEKQVASETLTVAQAILDADNTEWRDKARDNLREKLVHLEYGSGTSIYRITSSSVPKMYIQIIDRTGQLLLSDPGVFPENVAIQFAAKTSPSTKINVKWLSENGPIWVDRPIMDDHNRMIGRLRVLFIAEFNVWVQLQSILNFLLNTWSSVLFLSLPIGIACGLVASRYVTKQLQIMNVVTESWRQGNFEARIALPNDDVLIRHSQHLNDMAQDLELFLSLKQSMAVTDERTRLARELHDTVKQKLFALGLQLATAKAKPTVMATAGEHILEAETITREAQQDLMEIITQLHPAGTSKHSLYERIASIAGDFKRRFDVQVELVRAEHPPCNAHTEHQVLRVVQEALMNAVRHGQATHIIITSKIEHGLCTLAIADNGSGFDTGKPSGGFGITSMRDRVLALPNGKFGINSAAGAGTHITLSWKHKA